MKLLPFGCFFVSAIAFLMSMCIQYWLDQSHGLRSTVTKISWTELVGEPTSPNRVALGDNKMSYKCPAAY